MIAASLSQFQPFKKLKVYIIKVKMATALLSANGISWWPLAIKVITCGICQNRSLSQAPIVRSQRTRKGTKMVIKEKTFSLQSSVLVLLLGFQVTDQGLELWSLCVPIIKPLQLLCPCEQPGDIVAHKLRLPCSCRAA